MPKTKEQKKHQIDKLIKKLQDNKSVVFANYNGLKVKETEALRAKCRENALDCGMAKKNLLRLALKNLGIENIELEGEVIALFGNDEVAPAKTAAEFAKKHEALKIIAGVVDGKFATQKEIVALAKLPSREELLAKMVGSINAPISGFVNVLAGNIRNLVYVLNAIKSK
ncbi:50S ribosomal protein L10 [Candidatus Parcubacteria bacterium]|nr:50S ribosomal protein L10 [Patescibacteria group bacterium]MCG2694312.1 50S ribosomal protein L10 [Candidatus Parcubacteria bacterium]